MHVAKWIGVRAFTSLAGRSLVRGIAPGVAMLSLLAAAPEAPVTLGQVLAQMAEKDRVRIAALQGYTCTRRYTLHNQRFHQRAEVIVRMEYQAPGHKQFTVVSETGNHVIRQRVLHRLIVSESEASQDDMRRQTQITPENYEFSLIGTDTLNGRTCYLLTAKPKTQNKFLLQGRIWVDAEDFAIVRTEGRPAQNPSTLLRGTTFVHQYRKMGPFWLPVSNHSQTDSFLFGRTEIDIEYGEYQVKQSRTGSEEGDNTPSAWSWPVRSPFARWSALSNASIGKAECFAR